MPCAVMFYTLETQQCKKIFLNISNDDIKEKNNNMSKKKKNKKQRGGGEGEEEKKEGGRKKEREKQFPLPLWVLQSSEQSQ